jgi:hypothetical protein
MLGMPVAEHFGRLSGCRLPAFSAKNLILRRKVARLEQVVSNARQTVDDTFGEMKKAARKSGREAVLALEQHIEKHGCK